MTCGIEITKSLFRNDDLVLSVKCVKSKTKNVINGIAKLNSSVNRAKIKSR